MRLLTFSFLKSCKYKKFCSVSRSISTVLQPEVLPAVGDPNLVEVSPSWKESEEPALRSAVLRDMQVYPDFISEREEAALLTEVEPVLRRMRYEFDHWDNAIHGFRETERRQWSPENSVVLARVRALALGGEQAQALPHVHVLDLAAAGHIKPHIDAVRFCGDVIAGLCLASSAVMQLVHNDKKHLELNALLARRALYVMKGVARYEFTHAVLGGEHSTWRGARLPRLRRVALICRTAPRPHDAQPDVQRGALTDPDTPTP
ncbi:alpha-ketoglutarate-dependent dioxygenase alkB homolog 7, mitochondrial-like [Helicoverpa zea]|uniref:alpha-ketoglutarate-dependent dioxygenase alkB homolog 7, mitochondrial-like n=1 Tax=Helicoverpa zea TaxID=7113 RepID=UPI001F59DE58|nr:alpha-ketoglutarate-dependent dioxygenase alkB homolog 7, mitochondrial-like [Helicoverpa zea]